MNTWARVFPTIHMDANPGEQAVITVAATLSISLHPTEKSGRAACDKLGGIALEIAVSSLRGQFKPTKTHAVDEEGKSLGEQEAVTLANEDSEPIGEPAEEIFELTVIADPDSDAEWIAKVERELGAVAVCW